jgi:hypothetical protein
MKKFFLITLLVLLPQLALADGSQTFYSSGTFTVPAYGTLTVTVNGAGGGGGGGGLWACPYCGATGGTGGTSSFNGNIIGYGGGGGQGGSASSGSPGGAGSASGGSSNIPGGGSPGGSAGSGYGSSSLGSPGGQSASYSGGAGGAGGYDPYTGDGSPGTGGSVSISWTTPAAPTCSISLSPNPVAYGNSSTLSWSSTNANTSFYINNVGYVTSSGSTSVAPSSSTDYSGTVVGSGGTATCDASSGTPTGTLNVTAPSTPTATITSSLGSTMQVAQSSTITATFSVGSGDTLTADNIDGDSGNQSPWSGGLGANTNPTNPKSITFTPSSAGTYTFYARAQTNYYSSWTTYGSVTVTVQAPCTQGGVTIQSGQSATFYSQQTAPSGQLCSSVSQSRTCTNGVLSGSSSYQYGSCACTPTYSCSSNTIQYTDASCATTNVTSCVAPAFCSNGSSSCLYPAMVFVQNGDQSGDITATPAIVLQGLTSTLYWDVENAASCSVTGTDGEHWTGESSGSDGVQTSAITQETVFTLSCTGLDSTHTSQSATVNIVPVFREI